MNLLRGIEQPLFAQVAVALEAAEAFVISQIKIVGVGGRNAQFFVAGCAVPSHEVAAVREILPASPAVSGLSLIVGPGFVLGLRVTVGAAGAEPRDEAEYQWTGREGVGDEAGFLADDGHLHGDGNAPAPRRS